jgi:hypothetical protein
MVQLSPLPLPPFLCQSTVYTDSVWLGWGGVLSPIGDRILQEFDPFAPAAKRLSDRPENLHMGWKKIKNKNTF